MEDDVAGLVAQAFLKPAFTKKELVGQKISALELTEKNFESVSEVPHQLYLGLLGKRH